MKGLAALLLLLAACGKDPVEPMARKLEREKKVVALLPRLNEREVFDRVVAIGEVGPLDRATRPDYPEGIRTMACVALGSIGTVEARRRLELITDPALKYHVATGLAIADGGTDVDLGLREADIAAFGSLVDRIDEAAAFDRLVVLGRPGALRVLVDARTGMPRRDASGRQIRLFALALGRIGGEEARTWLVDMLERATGDAAKDGPVKLYAAAGLTILSNPGTAIDLLLNLSAVDPNDNVAALSDEGARGSYFTVDAQICEALLKLGLFEAEEDLVEQMKRRAWIRVLIDAHAVLRRQTGLDLPFRYNGSYADRDADAEAWRAKLRATRAQRVRDRPFHAADPRFVARLETVLEWLRGKRVNERFIARKVVQRLGPYAVPFLARELGSAHRIAQRQAALMLGRIGDPAGAPALRGALDLADAEARATAIEALRLLGDRAGRDAVVERLKDDDTEVRAMAATYLRDLGSRAVATALKAALDVERAPATRTRLLCALLRHGDTGAAAELAEVLVKGEQHDREAALAGLQEAAGVDTGIDALAPVEERRRAARRLTEKIK